MASPHSTRIHLRRSCLFPGASPVALPAPAPEVPPRESSSGRAAMSPKSTPALPTARSQRRRATAGSSLSPASIRNARTRPALISSCSTARPGLRGWNESWRRREHRLEPGSAPTLPGCERRFRPFRSRARPERHLPTREFHHPGHLPELPALHRCRRHGWHHHPQKRSPEVLSHPYGHPIIP